MKSFVNDQVRYFELLQEKQKIVNELKELEVASTVSFVFPRETHPVSYEFPTVNEEILSWFREGDVASSIWELTTPIVSLYTGFDKSSVSMPIEDSYQSIKAFFKDNLNIKAKINVVERAHFKIFIP